MLTKNIVILLLVGSIQITTTQNSQNVIQFSPEKRKLAEEYRLTMVMFMVPYCPFSQEFRPVFEQLADIFAQHAPANAVLFGIVDCKEQEEFCEEEGIDKYPTLKILRYGRTMKQEYRGPRTFEDMWKFVSKEMMENILYVNARKKPTLAIVKALPTKTTMIGAVLAPNYHDSLHYKHFKIAAYLEKDNCDFYLVYNVSDYGDRMTLKEAMTQRVADVIYFEGLSVEEIQSWMNEKCVSAIRELTLENAEEIIAEGYPLLILFYDEDSQHLKKKFYEMVRLHFREDRKWMNFVTANGSLFENILAQMNRTKDNLPLICIDSLRHMYELPKNATEVLQLSTHLRKFLDSFYSGDLHYEFHKQDMDELISEMDQELEMHSRIQATTPVESAFVKLGPSRLKYTMKHDEL